MQKPLGCPIHQGFPSGFSLPTVKDGIIPHIYFG